jgi:hypothetical protein
MDPGRRSNPQGWRSPNQPDDHLRGERGQLPEHLQLSGPGRGCLPLHGQQLSWSRPVPGSNKRKRCLSNQLLEQTHISHCSGEGVLHALSWVLECPTE